MGIGSDKEIALVALNRFGLGGRPGSLADASQDPRGFLARELKSPRIAILSTDLPSSADALQQVFEFQRRKREERRAAVAAKAENVPAAGMDMSKGEAPPDEAASPNAGMPGTADGAGGATADTKPMTRNDRIAQSLFEDEVLARMEKQAIADAGYVERLVAFWSNHFAVSIAKGQVVRAAAGPFEREAIRPHVLGRFRDMLLAVEQHPAMLFYLDNQRSIGPNSRAGRNRGKGLNENLAREILELHTLGVGGGYSQADVTSLAAILTGWSFVGRNGEPGEIGHFLFRRNWHEPGDQQLLGETYPEDGAEQGQAALANLARHSATARHIATKLTRHFVADEPPPSLVDRLTKLFMDTDGDLAALSLALIEHDEAWRAPMTKIRSPAEFFIAIRRATGFVPAKPQFTMSALRAMGMVPWNPPGPNGYPDTVAAWASPDVMKARLDVSWRTAQQIKTLGDPLGILDEIAGAAASRETRDAMSRAESRQQALAILFMSPEFQRR